MDAPGKTGWLGFLQDDLEETKKPFYKRREFILALLIFAFGLAIYLPGIGGYPLWDPWEPHYSQVAMEMNEHGSWLVPHYRNKTRWFSKPVFPLWMFKTSFIIFGQNEFAARFHVVLMASLGLAMICFLMGRLFNWKAGLLSALILGASPQYFFLARQAIYDGPYVVIQTIAIACLMVGLFAKPEKPRYIYAFWVVSAFAMLSKGLLSVVLPASIIGAYIIATWDWGILKRMRFTRGLVIFLALASPWFIFMTCKYGYPYFKSFFIYHHFERMAGLIKKPNDTFELYVQQLFYATFPWSAFLPMALMRFFSGSNAEDNGERRKKLFFFLSFAMPYIFFSLGSTKFNHYIFPVIPFLAVILAVYLVKMVEEPWKPYMRIDIILAVFIFAILAKDLVTNYKHLIHLFVYYYDRPLPRGLADSIRPVFYAIFIPMGFAIGLPLIRRRLNALCVTGLLALAIVFSLFMNNWVMPRLADTFSQKKLWEAYTAQAKNGEPVCEYHSWQRRSVSYYFNNESKYIDSRKSKRGERFFKRPGKWFCMVDRSQYSRLREKVKSISDRDLYLVNSDHPTTYLVATEPLKEKKRQEKKYLLENMPVLQNRLKAVWDDSIELLGWEIPKEKVKIGDKVELNLYFKALRDIEKDYRIFIHGEVRNTVGRLNGDHYPAGGNYPTDRWKAGQIIKDTWSGVITSRISTGSMDFYIGFFDKDGRLKITDGPVDRNGRVQTGSVKIRD